MVDKIKKIVYNHFGNEEKACLSRTIFQKKVNDQCYCQNNIDHN